MGCQPRARSVLRCQGVLVLRHGPLTAAVQDESPLQKDTSKLAVGSAEGQAKLRFGASFSLGRSCAGRKPAARGRRQLCTCWHLAMEEGKQMWRVCGRYEASF